MAKIWFRAGYEANVTDEEMEALYTAAKKKGKLKVKKHMGSWNLLLTGQFFPARHISLVKIAAVWMIMTTRKRKSLFYFNFHKLQQLTPKKNSTHKKGEKYGTEITDICQI